MQRFYRFSAILFVTALVTLLQTVAVNADLGFRIEDYRPDSLVDFQWRITPQASRGLPFPYQSPSRIFSYSFNRSNTTDVLGEEELESRNLSLRLDSDWDYYNYTLDRTLRFNATLSADLDSDISEQSDERHKPSFTQSLAEWENSGGNLRVSLNGRLEKYLAGDLFASVNASLRGAVGDQDNRQSSRSEFSSLTRWRLDIRELDYDFDPRSYDASLGAGLGIGRTHTGRYSYSAWYILNELDSEGISTGALSKAQFVELAALIYELKETHIIDSRIRRIEATNTIAEFLLRSGVITEPSYLAQAIITDAWDYSPQDRRTFGWKAQVEIDYSVGEDLDDLVVTQYSLRRDYRYDTLGVLIDSFVNESTSREFVDQYSRGSGATLEVSTEWYRQISMRSQVVIGSSLRHRFDNSSRSTKEHATDNGPTRVERDGSETYDDIYATLFCSYDYIFSSRTRLNLRASGNYYSYGRTSTREVLYDGSFVPPPQIREFYRRNRRVQFSSSLEYRVAIPSTVSAGLALNYDDSRTETPARVDRDYRRLSVYVGFETFLY